MKLGLEGGRPRHHRRQQGHRSRDRAPARGGGRQGADLRAPRNSRWRNAELTSSGHRALEVETLSLDVTDLAQIEQLAGGRPRASWPHRHPRQQRRARAPTSRSSTITDEELQYGMAINFFAQFRHLPAHHPDHDRARTAAASSMSRRNRDHGDDAAVPVVLHRTGEVGRNPLLQDSGQRIRAAQHSRQLRRSRFRSTLRSVSRNGSANSPSAISAGGGGSEAQALVGRATRCATRAGARRRNSPI